MEIYLKGLRMTILQKSAYWQRKTSLYVFISLQLTENGRLLIFSRKMFLAKNPWDCQIRSNQTVASTEYNEPFPFLINRKNVKQQISKITTKDTSLYVATTSQRRRSHLGTSCYIARTSQIVRFCLRTGGTSQRRLK